MEFIKETDEAIASWSEGDIEDAVLEALGDTHKSITHGIVPCFGLVVRLSGILVRVFVRFNRN